MKVKDAGMWGPSEKERARAKESAGIVERKDILPESAQKEMEEEKVGKAAKEKEARVVERQEAKGWDQEARAQ